SALQPLGEQAGPIAVMPNQLDQASFAPAEDPQIAGMRIALQRLLHQQGQRMETPAHVGVACCQPHARPARKRDHRQRSRVVSAPITLDSVAASGAPSIFRRTCAPNAIVIEAGARCGADPASPAHSGSLASGATITGTNAGLSRAACRRHRYSRLTSTPAPRAISVTTAPGSSIAANQPRLLRRAPATATFNRRDDLDATHGG